MQLTATLFASLVAVASAAPQLGFGGFGGFGGLGGVGYDGYVDGVDVVDDGLAGYGGYGGYGGFIPIPVEANIDDNQNNNINLNDNQDTNIQDNTNRYDSFRSIDNIINNYCRYNEETGDLTYLGKRSDLVKRNAFGGFGGFGIPAFANFDFNNNQNANVNQNANLDENFLQSFNNDGSRFDSGYETGGRDGFLGGLGAGSFGRLIDCFFTEEGALVAGRR